VPALRERREDIPLLVSAFVDEFAQAMGKPIEAIAKSSLQALQSYGWPGNVRELRNLIERSVILATGPTLKIELPDGAASAAPRSLATLAEAEREHVLRVLESAAWRIRGPGGAAEVLGLKPSTLESRMAKLGIRRPSR
jgi:transcriptional regulator with GAF, ATPase, and Fis domain